MKLTKNYYFSIVIYMSDPDNKALSSESAFSPPRPTPRERAQMRSVIIDEQTKTTLAELNAALDTKEKHEKTLLESPLQINEGMCAAVVQDAQFVNEDAKKHYTDPTLICVQILLELLLAGETIGLKNTEPVLRKFAEYPNAEYSRDRIEEYMRKALLWPIQHNYVVIAPIS